MVKLKKIEGRIRDLDNLVDSERTDTDPLTDPLQTRLCYDKDPIVRRPYFSRKVCEKWTILR